MLLRIQFRQFCHVIMAINLLLINDTEAHCLLGDGPRVNLLFHGAHSQKTINIARLVLSQTENSEDTLF